MSAGISESSGVIDAIGAFGASGNSGMAAAACPARLRLTRRGRAVAAAAVILAVAAIVTILLTGVAGGAEASSHGAPARSPYSGMTQVVVRPGQTLWSVALQAEPSANVWSVVQQIISVNALGSTQIQAGQQLWVPRS